MSSSRKRRRERGEVREQEGARGHEEVREQEEVRSQGEVREQNEARGRPDTEMQLKQRVKDRHHQIEKALESAKSLKTTMIEGASTNNVNVNLSINCTINMFPNPLLNTTFEDKLNAHIKLLEDLLNASRQDIVNFNV